jgi:predicted acyltransferase
MSLFKEATNAATGVPGARVAGGPILASAGRLASLDQFRGYTVAGMILVNFWASYAVTPAVLRHHQSYCSYADTIMPQFLFAVGFSCRLTFRRRVQAQGKAAAYRRLARRLGALTLLALVLYSLEAWWSNWYGLAVSGWEEGLAVLFKRSWFQTLLHIAVTSLWILPVIGAGAAVRIGYLVLSAGAHVALSSWFNFAWVNSPPYSHDGGPLGFLTWTIPTLVGTLACDAVTGWPARPFVGKLLAWSGLLMVLGYVLSCPTRLYDGAGAEQPSGPELATSPPQPHLRQGLGPEEPVGRERGALHVQVQPQRLARHVVPRGHGPA